MTRIFPGFVALLILGVACACGEARSEAIWKEVAGTNDLLRGDAQEAVSRLRESVNADPTYTAAHTNLGWALIYDTERPENLRAARAQFTEAIKTAETRPSLLPFLDAVFHRDRPRYDGEVRRIGLVASNNIGAAQIGLGRFKEARKTLQAAIARFRDSARLIDGFETDNARDYAEIEFHLGRAYADLAPTTEEPGLYAKAIDHYTTAIETLEAIDAERAFPDPYFWRASAHLAGDGGAKAKKAAFDDYVRWVELGGRDPDVTEYIRVHGESEGK